MIGGHKKIEENERSIQVGLHVADGPRRRRTAEGDTDVSLRREREKGRRSRDREEEKWAEVLGWAYL